MTGPKGFAFGACLLSLYIASCIGLALMPPSDSGEVSAGEQKVIILVPQTTPPIPEPISVGSEVESKAESNVENSQATSCVESETVSETTSETESIAESIIPPGTQESEIEPREESPKHSYTYDADEQYLLAQLIQAEVGNESYECKIAVGSVVLNRVASSYCPDTIREVIYDQTNGIVQWSVTIKRNGHAAIDCVPSESSLQAAKYVMENGSQLPEGVLFCFASYSTNAWMLSLPVYTQIDNTIFSYAK